MRLFAWGKSKSPEKRIAKEAHRAQSLLQRMKSFGLFRGEPWNVARPCNKPFAALEQIVVFTSWIVPKGSSEILQLSPVVQGLISDSVKMALIDIIKGLPISLVHDTEVLSSIEEYGRLPDSAWTAVAAVRPRLAEQTRDGLLDVFIRPYIHQARGDSGVVLFFYRAR